VRYAHQHPIELGYELETETFTLGLVPARCLLELNLRDRFDSEVLHGFRERIASTASRARAPDSSRE
jgi:hypothetical protein